MLLSPVLYSRAFLCLLKLEVLDIRLSVVRNFMPLMGFIEAVVSLLCEYVRGWTILLTLSLKSIPGDENMLKNTFNISIAIMSIFATNVFASDDKCKLEVDVMEGSTINTINVSESVQVGTIHLKLSNGFEEDGGVIGRITSQNEYTGASTLDHNVFFTDGSRIETTGDQAQITDDDGSGCSFTVVETINDFWGPKTFKRASGTITAEGTISFCEGANGNSFKLTGTVCLK